MTADDRAGAAREALAQLLELHAQTTQGTWRSLWGAPENGPFVRHDHPSIYTEGGEEIFGVTKYDGAWHPTVTREDAAFVVAAHALVPVLGAALDAAEADKKNLNLIVDDISDLANAVHDVGYWDATKGEQSEEYREASERASWLWVGMEQRAGRPVWKARPGNGEERPVETEGMFAFTTEEIWAQLEAAKAETERLKVYEKAYLDAVPFLFAHGLLEEVEDGPTH